MCEREREREGGRGRERERERERQTDRDRDRQTEIQMVYYPTRGNIDRFAALVHAISSVTSSVTMSCRAG